MLNVIHYRGAKKFNLCCDAPGFLSVTLYSKETVGMRDEWLGQRDGWLNYRARIQGIDSEESILPAYVAWRTGTTNRVVVPARQAGNRLLSSSKGLQIRALLVSRNPDIPR
jgi:hypothetical protein